MTRLPPLKISDLMRSYGLHPKKSLGQNFLVDENALRKVVAAAEIQPEDIVLEIGAGLGSLTRYLAVEAKQVIAVEIDRSLIMPMEQVLAPFENVTVLQGDMLEMNPAEIIPDSAASYKVVANIPYYITSALIRQLLEADRQPKQIVLTLQLEVARRICAGPGDMSLLALGVQVYGAPFIDAVIPAGAFYPRPNVDSAVVRIDLYPIPAVPPERLDDYFRLAKAGFSQKRKTLRNSLSGGMRISKKSARALLEDANIDPQRRAETLSLIEWQNLTEAFSRQDSASE